MKSRFDATRVALSLLLSITTASAWADMPASPQQSSQVAVARNAGQTAAVEVAKPATTRSLAIAPAPAAASPAFGMMQGVLGLVLVIGLIYGAGWVVKRTMPAGSTRGPFRLLGSTSVGPKERVVALAFGDQTMVLGVTTHGIALLHSEKGAAVAKPTNPEVPNTGGGFVERLLAAKRHLEEHRRG